MVPGSTFIYGSNFWIVTLKPRCLRSKPRDEAVIPFPKEKEILIEYARLKSSMGDGEAACMAVAKHTKDYIASSNLKDIKAYCDYFGIVYLTTMDILLEAYQKGIMSEAQCNAFIKEVKSKDSKLIDGIDTIKQYEEKVKK